MSDERTSPVTSPPSSKVAEEAPERIGNIEIRGLLAQGGMGSVYLGVDTRLKRRVAIKSLRPERGFDTQSRARFLREAELISALEHPNICRVYDLIQHQGRDYLVLELIHGRTLTETRKAGMRFKEKLKVARQVADVLGTAHEHGVVHRDLKPSNVMITKAGDVKVLDFGIAHSVKSRPDGGGPNAPETVNPIAEEHDGEIANASSLCFRTEYGIVSGTPGFMSPEQARCETTTAASDMYVLGLLLHWLFSDAPPYSSQLDTDAVMLKAMRGHTEPVRGLSTDLTRLIERLKAPAPELRPTAVEAASVLRQIANKPKRRLVLAVSLAFVLTLAAGATVSAMGFLRARQAQAKAEAVNQYLTDMLGAANPLVLGKDVRVVDTLDAAVEGLATRFENQPEVRAAVAHALGVTYSSLGVDARAEPLLQTALTLRERHLGPFHPDTLASMTQLGHVLANLDRLESAERLCTRALEDANTHLGPDHGVTFRARRNLARLRALQARFDEAATLYRESLQQARRQLGPKHLETRLIMGDLAQVDGQQGKIQDAERLCRQVLALDEQVADKDDPLIGLHAYYLGSILVGQGKYREAEQNLRRALALHEREFGADHPETLETQRLLAVALLYSGQYQEAATEFRTVASRSRTLFGPKSNLTRAALNSLGGALLMQGAYSEAEAILTELLDLNREVAGPEHPDTLAAMANLAHALASQKKFSQALPLMRQNLALKKKANGATHPATLKAMSNLGELLSLMGQHQEAESLLRQTVALEERNLGENHPVTLNAMAALAVDLRLQNRLDESKDLFVMTLKRAEQALGKDHPVCLAVMKELGRVFLAKCEPQQARSWFERAAQSGHAEAQIELDHLHSPAAEATREE